MIRNSCLMFTLLVCNSSFGYIYRLSVKRNKVINKVTNKKQLIVFLWEYHLKSHPVNKSQRAYIESLLKRCVGLKGKLIVEDLSSVSNDGRIGCCNFGINCSEGVLGQLANKARSWSIAVDNVEYRYCRVAAIGPLLSNIKANPDSFRSSAVIPTVSLHKEVVDQIEKIKKYDDGKLLNDLYKRTTSSVNTALSKLGFKGKGTVAQYCAPLMRKEYRQELENLCIFDSALIDMNIIHSIVTSSVEPIIFVLAGGSHIENVSSVLERIGYEVVIQESANSSGPLLKKVLNSDSVSAASDVHPLPVDITIIDTFIR